MPPVRLALLGLLALSACVPRSRFGEGAAASGGAAFNATRLTKGKGPWVAVPSRAWAMRWGGQEGAVVAQWEATLRWPAPSTLDEPLVWIGVTGGGACGEHPGAVVLPQPEGRVTTLPTVTDRGRSLWAAEWLGALGWPQAWRPVWILEFSPSDEARVRWESPASATVAAIRATPCLLGWVGVPARAYWMQQSPDVTAGGPPILPTRPR